MKRAAIFGMILLLTALASAQTADISVRLYYQHPPQRLTIVPKNTRWKQCSSCPIKILAASLNIEAAGEQLRMAESHRKYSVFKLSGDYRLQGFQHPPLEATYPLEIRAHNGQLLITLAMPLEDYVTAVVAGEAGEFSSAQSLQAMAVAVRTFAVRFRGRHQAEGFDYCDTTHCQDFHLSAVDDRVRAAVTATEGELLWYRGELAATYYHQNCGGTTADSSDVWPTQKLPYLREHADPYCPRQGKGNWQTTLAKTDIEKALKQANLRLPTGWRAIEVQSRTHTGRVQELQFTGGSGTYEKISASSFRFAVDRALGWNQIRSDLYEIRDAGREIVFSGRGSGHGVGLCQIGTAEMGQEGKSYREILAFYYPGTSLGLTAQGLSWESQSSERVDLISTHAKEDAPLIPLAERLMSDAEARSGLHFDFRPRLKVYPSLSVYRDSTGKPGWVAASSLGHTIRLQPVGLLRRRTALESTLRHELLHQLIEAHAHPGLPIWFREGLVLYLSGDQGQSAQMKMSSLSLDKLESILKHPQDQQQMRIAYAAARARVAELIRQNGKTAVMDWLIRGPRPGILMQSGTAPLSQH